MQTKDLMFAYLQENGYMPKSENYGIHFRFEGLNYLYFNNDNDNAFFQLLLPNFFEIDDNNRQKAYAAMNAANSAAKVVKVVDHDNHVWVHFEILLDGTPELDDIVPRALAMLQNGRNEFLRAFLG
mgnify:CR=1 FL=1